MTALLTLLGLGKTRTSHVRSWYTSNGQTQLEGQGRLPPKRQALGPGAGTPSLREARLGTFVHLRPVCGARWTIEGPGTRLALGQLELEHWLGQERVPAEPE